MSNVNLTPASQLADRILRAAQKARSEEDLKIAVEQALEKALTTLGIESAPEYEKTILRGSADAVYGHVVIEYERPGKLAKEAGRSETIGNTPSLFRLPSLSPNQQALKNTLVGSLTSAKC